MAIRNKAFKDQRAQFGLEAVKGVRSPASLFPQSLNLTIKPVLETDSVMPSGASFKSAAYITDERSEGSGDGVLCYNNLAALYYLVFGKPVTSAAGGFFTRTYKFKEDRPTISVEYGDSSDASVAVGMFATSLDVEIGKNSNTSSVSIGFEGNKVIDEVELTDEADITKLPIAPATANHTQIYGSLNPNFEIGLSTLLTGYLSAKFSLSGLATRVRLFDRDVNLAAIPDSSVELKMNLQTEEGKTLLKYLREGKVFYIAIVQESEGQKHIIKAPVMAESNDRGDDSGLYVATYTCHVLANEQSEPEFIITNKQPFGVFDGVEIPPAPGVQSQSTEPDETDAE